MILFVVEYEAVIGTAQTGERSMAHYLMSVHGPAEMGEARKRRGSLSPTTMAMTHMTHGLETLVDESRMRYSSFYRSNPYLHGSTQQILQQTFNQTSLPNVAVAREGDDLPLSRAEWTAVNTRFRPARDALRVAFDTDGWWSDDKNEAREQKNEYHKQFELAMNQLKLNKHESIYLIEMMRAVMVRPAKQDRSAPEGMTLTDAMAALKLINANAKKKRWPTSGSGVAVVTWDALQALYNNGYELKRRGTFKEVAHDTNLLFICFNSISRCPFMVTDFLTILTEANSFWGNCCILHLLILQLLRNFLEDTHRFPPSFSINIISDFWLFFKLVKLLDRNPTYYSRDIIFKR